MCTETGAEYPARVIIAAGGIATRTMNYNRPICEFTRPEEIIIRDQIMQDQDQEIMVSYNRPGYQWITKRMDDLVTGTILHSGSNRPSIYSDRQGNVYQRPQSNSNWQQRQNRSWSPVNNARPEVQNLNRQQMNRSRGEMRAQNFQRIPSSPFVQVGIRFPFFRWRWWFASFRWRRWWRRFTSHPVAVAAVVSRPGGGGRRR